jgi:hypothetical protein
MGPIFTCPRCGKELGITQEKGKPPVPDACRNPFCTGEESPEPDVNDRTKNNSYT